MERVAVFPGTFDPFTRGHASIVRKALPLFDRIIIAVGQNSTKNALFSLEARTDWIRELYQDEPRIAVEHYDGLTVDFCRYKKSSFILRGLRNATDYQYEASIAQMNEALQNDIVTVLLVCDPADAAINASIVREIYKSGGNIQMFLPNGFTKLQRKP